MQLATISESEQDTVMRRHQADVQEAAQAVERLLIVRLGSMGDIIHALPAATLLRRLLSGRKERPAEVEMGYWNRV